MTPTLTEISDDKTTCYHVNHITVTNDFHHTQYKAPVTSHQVNNKLSREGGREGW